MLPFILFAQLVTASFSAGDSTYSTEALRNMIAAAAVENRRPPALLASYRSDVETEFALMIRDTLGREHTAEIEQLASVARWRRDGDYELHVVGYRSQNVGVPYSTLSFIKAWTVPMLYGERLLLGAYSTRTSADDTIRAVHPFAADRADFYRFTGGDTVTVLRAGARTIPITRIRVTPYYRGASRLAAFDGEIDLDADRSQIVRMRGRFVVLGGRRTARQRMVERLGVVGVAYVEFVNAEVGGRYWLPTYQRTEFQANIPMLGQTRPVIRLVSNISNIAVSEGLAGADTVATPRIAVTWAPTDSVSAYAAWQHEIGTQSAAVHADDFDDVAPDVWRATGPPRVSLFPNTTSRILRFNRVEGLFTGVAPSVDFRNAAPGLKVSANVGWAWSEGAVRGGASASYERGLNTIGARGERTLASTNDFELPLSEDPGLSAIVSSIDDYDYVDRRVGMLSLTHVLSAINTGIATVQMGVGQDAPERARLEHGLLRGATSFRANRGAAGGRYALVQADVELHPNVTGDFVQPGVGMRVHYEGATGQLDWQRIEIGLSARRYWGPISVSAHADAGTVLGAAPPPQTLFELGGNAALPGYDYKQFVGNRAALFRTFAGYRFGILDRPMHAWKNYVVPGINPGIGASAQGGWTEISSPGAAAAVRLLGLRADGTPVSDPTHGIRASVGVGLTFFSDILHVGVARPVDRPARWRLVAGFGSAF